MLKLIQNGALAALIAQMSFSPRDMDGFERAVLAAHEEPNLSREELAERAGVPRATLGRWMTEAPEVFRVA
jgi:DNA-binding transcriptional regulator YiaG